MASEAPGPTGAAYWACGTGLLPSTAISGSRALPTAALSSPHTFRSQAHVQRLDEERSSWRPVRDPARARHLARGERTAIGLVTTRPSRSRARAVDLVAGRRHGEPRRAERRDTLAGGLAGR